MYFSSEKDMNLGGKEGESSGLNVYVLSKFMC